MSAPSSRCSSPSAGTGPGRSGRNHRGLEPRRPRFGIGDAGPKSQSRRASIEPPAAKSALIRRRGAISAVSLPAGFSYRLKSAAHQLPNRCRPTRHSMLKSESSRAVISSTVSGICNRTVRARVACKLPFFMSGPPAQPAGPFHQSPARAVLRPGRRYHGWPGPNNRDHLGNTTWLKT